MKDFDPLLFNGLGSKRERKWNHAMYSILAFNVAYSLFIASYILYGIVVKKWYYENWFLISYIIIVLNCLVFLLLWLYLHILIFKHARKNKHINKNNPLLICKYQGSFKNYCIWIVGFMIMFLLYFMCIFLSIFSPPFLCLVLLHFYLSNPFLLKRILLFEEYVILEYRIFGNVKLSRESLTLMKIPQLSRNLALVRPELFDKDKYPHIIANFCTRFNPFGMTNLNTLRQELVSKLGYSPYEMTNNKFILSTELKNMNCLKIYI